MGRQRTKMRVWTLPEVKNVLPLVRTILMDIRERCIIGNAILLRIRRGQDINLAEQRENDAAITNNMTELQTLGVFCVDPIQAVAVFSFKRSRQLAWFVYSPFGNELYWRLDNDLPQVKRSVDDLGSHVVEEK